MKKRLLTLFLILKFTSNSGCSSNSEYPKKGENLHLNPKFSDSKYYFSSENDEIKAHKNLIWQNAAADADYWTDFLEIKWTDQAAPSDKNSLYVLGDADGSFLRIVFSAWAAGYINIDSSVFEDIKFLEQIEESAKDLNVDKLENFQKNKNVYNACSRIINAITYNQKNNSKLVFLGDILFDRLTCNLTATLTLIEKLHNIGAVFIKGNHDDENLIDDPIFGKAQSGEFRALQSSENKENCRKIMQNCFKLAHYDSDFNILFTHAMIEYLSDSQLRYCEKIIPNQDASSLADFINKLDNREVLDHMTDFRRFTKQHDDTIKIRKPYTPSKFIHLHGHDEEFALENCLYDIKNIKNNKYSLNSRDSNKQMHPKICQIIKKI